MSFTKNDEQINRAGAPTKKELVMSWRKRNPSGSKYRCSQDLEIDIKTVRKWWDYEGQEVIIINDENLERIEKLAKKNHINQSELTNKIIDWYFKQIEKNRR